jgi:membrane-associated phospholipid phosphatase
MRFSKKNLQFLLVSLFSFFLFGLFSFLVKEDLLTQIDFDTTVRLQDNLPRRVDFVFSLFSVIGHFEIMLILLVAFFAVMRKWIMGLVGFVAFGFFHVVELIGKTFVTHPPPPFFMLRTEHPIEFPQFYVSTESSYPSGHSGRAVFMAILFLFFLWRSKRFSFEVKIGLTGVISVYVLLMWVSRVYLGEHWLSDVIGGSLLAAAFAFGVLVFSNISLRKRRVSSLKE